MANVVLVSGEARTTGPEGANVAAGMVFSLIIIFQTGARYWHITFGQRLSHASMVWQIPALSQFWFNLR